MTDAASDSARSLRRLLVLLLVAALAAAGGALALALLDRPADVPPRPSIFAPTFRDPTFVDGTIRLVSSRDAAPSTRALTNALTLPAKGTVYLVARCDRGIVTVRAGSLSSSRPCTGQAIGVLALQMGRTAKLTATVDATQTTRWGVALYR